MFENIFYSILYYIINDNQNLKIIKYIYFLIIKIIVF
ncbi:hypothetical protein cco112_05137 [Campylobacter coli 2685]|nr:hypothetical protein cco112_05137 [Campylobacter coli 2685]